MPGGRVGMKWTAFRVEVLEGVNVTEYELEVTRESQFGEYTTCRKRDVGFGGWQPCDSSLFPLSRAGKSVSDQLRKGLWAWVQLESTRGFGYDAHNAMKILAQVRDEFPEVLALEPELEAQLKAIYQARAILDLVNDTARRHRDG